MFYVNISSIYAVLMCIAHFVLNFVLAKVNVFEYMKVISVHYFAFRWLFYILMLYAASSYAQKDSVSISNAILKNGLSLMHYPYVAGTLECPGPEKLVYYSDKFDCVTFVEYVLAKSLTQLDSGKNDTDFETILTQLRYRNGVIDGYGSRLHYFTEWILELEKNGFARQVTKKAGGEPYNKKIQFMTKHRHLYPHLNDTDVITAVEVAESRIQQHYWYYIPKNKVAASYSYIEDADIIAITSAQSDLDISHTGIAIKKGNAVYLLHASEAEGRIVVTREPLHQYIEKHREQTGIMVVRCGL